MNLDAYTVRKAVPRILIAAIGINLSIYLCVAAVDITNVVGRGVAELLTDPFLRPDTFNAVGIENNITNNIATGGLIIGSLIGGGFIWTSTIAGAGVASAGIGIIAVLAPMLITVGLITLAIMFTLVIRQALLVFLTVISPVAIALFVLPGTEKYFKTWLDTFIKTLLVYPIIAVIFAMSTVMGAILLGTAGESSGPIGLAKIIATILVVFAPLVLIPFAFKLAGGAISAVMNAGSARAGSFSERAAKGIEKKRQDPNSFLGNIERDRRNRNINRRSELNQKYKDMQDTGGGFKRMYGRRMSAMVGGVNIEAQASAHRAEQSKIMQDQIATGRDEEIRGLTVNKKAADSDWDNGLKEYVVDPGNGKRYAQSRNGLKRVEVDASGKELGPATYKTLGGAWVSESDVDAGHRRWGNDSYAQQAALSYEMRKAASDEDHQGIADRYESLAMANKEDGGWGLSSGTAAGVLKGAGFENQQSALQYKHMGVDGKVNYAAFTKEMYEKKGSYSISQMSGETVEHLKKAYEHAEATGNTEMQGQLKGVAESFMQRSSSLPVGEDGERIPMRGGASSEPYVPGAAGVSDHVLDFARTAGVYTDPAPRSSGPRDYSGDRG